MAHPDGRKNTAGSQDVYQPPRIVKISDLRSGDGLCFPGSGDTQCCINTGNSATPGCHNTGNSANGSCVSGISAACPTDFDRCRD